MNLKVINLNIPIGKLCSEFPEMVDIMAELGFDGITKPGMLQTAGRVMTIPNGCRMKGIDLQTVIHTLEKKGFTIKI
ncbi:DUF1858 domain-containing protein [Cytobacillus sp. FJAT-54145]|uniref:DUF1858 domain-containing protein n=1 Tax=Cytobacillus spartinae TaxID=3299023 RepID=A0ABW6K9V2_9BACI